MTSRTRLGVFGGTFDPVHVGHLVAAINARHTCSLDEVLLVVAGEPWQKAGARDITPADVRMRAVEAAVGSVEGISASDIEINRGGPSYTIDTLRQLKAERPEADLFLIIGTDVAESLETWDRFDEVSDVADLVVVKRYGSPRQHLDAKWRVHHVDMPALDISSTDLRERLADGRPLDYLVPEAAVACLRAAGLYAVGRTAAE
jgi:nicotinate-nucleotide adenylyltransferase